MVGWVGVNCRREEGCVNAAIGVAAGVAAGVDVVAVVADRGIVALDLPSLPVPVAADAVGLW